MNKYFISYVFSKNNVRGYGNTETHYSKEIEGVNDTKTISRSIEKDMDMDENSLVILNFIKLV